MADAIPSFTLSNDSTVLSEVSGDDMGSVRAGAISVTREIHIWNNKGGSSDVNTMQNVQMTDVTLEGGDSGGDIEEGKEIVEQRMMSVRDVTGGGVSFTPVGGAVTKTLANIRGDKLATPGQPLGVPTHGSGGLIIPGAYFARISAVDETGETLAGVESAQIDVLPLISQETANTDGETLTSGGNSKVSRKFTSPFDYCNGVILQMSAGGSLVGTLRIETDNAGVPSGTLANANAQVTGVALNNGTDTAIMFEDEVTLTQNGIYHIVFIITSGTGTLKGIGTGSTRLAKYNDGTWHDSAILYDYYFKLIGDNIITWGWDEVYGAVSYKIFRTQTTGVYGASCLVQAGIEEATFDDGFSTLLVGTPLGAATVTYQHKHVIEVKITVPTTATEGSLSFYPEVRYTEGDV